MKERPILFSGPMVRALLSGQKTQTRRAIKPQPFIDDRGNVVWPDPKKGPANYGQHMDGQPNWDSIIRWRCPYGQVGDRLWVREAHSIHDTHGQHRKDGLRWGPWADLPTQMNEEGTKIAYFREGFDRCAPGKWRPSIHMPRWASRLTLEITEVRVERLLACSDADARAEGLKWVTPGMWSVDRSLPIIGNDARKVYFELWDHINGPGSAAANPWVWAITFEVMK